MVILGIILHLIGGLAAGSFYIPYKKVRLWSWESYWIAGGVFSWIAAPWIVALLTVPNLFQILAGAEMSDILWTYFMGILWGVGGLTFGLTMRFLGVSLGMAIALGFCSVFGTLIPPIYDGSFFSFMKEISGITIFAGVVVCVLGIAVCGWAGISKEKEMPESMKKEAITEFNLFKGLAVAVFSGILSACMAFGFSAGKPIANLAMQYGTDPLWQNSPVLIVILAGGFTINFIWCLALNIKNNSLQNYYDRSTPLLKNYLFSAVAGIIWYLQFMFYGMGSSKMGKYDYASWTLHMAFIIIFSNLWGLYYKEWKGSSNKTMQLVRFGIMVVIFSTIIIGLGNYYGSKVSAGH
ncbi:MAG: L-rhamnose/proton symporter RhaT [Cytophagaceae bacterium]